MTEPVVCARAIMTPDNCVAETERLIAAALYHRRPVYMAFPFDYANLPVVARAPTTAVIPQTDQVALEAAVAAIADAIHAARSACVLPGILITRCGLGA
jgi:indolepyruvate decarboxylase